MKNPTFLFCENPLRRTAPDEEYVKEYSTLQKMGADLVLFNYEALTQDEAVEKALKRVVPSDSVRPMIYRGWMLKPKMYENLYNALLQKGFRLINDPIQYQRCHYLPENYSLLESWTPRTRYLAQNGEFDKKEIKNILDSFGTSAIIIKDYVKSLKHQWSTACFIPNASDTQHAQKVIDEFLDWQADDLNEGLVFRQYVPLQELTIHSKSGMPLHLEYRLFFRDHELVDCCDYWEEGNYSDYEKPPLEQFCQIAKRIDSRFFTMDVAKTKQNEWTIIELGDAQVSGIPENTNLERFYEHLLCCEQ